MQGGGPPSQCCSKRKSTALSVEPEYVTSADREPSAQVIAPTSVAGPVPASQGRGIERVPLPVRLREGPALSRADRTLSAAQRPAFQRSPTSSYPRGSGAKGDWDQLPTDREDPDRAPGGTAKQAPPCLASAARGAAHPPLPMLSRLVKWTPAPSKGTLGRAPPPSRRPCPAPSRAPCPELLPRGGAPSAGARPLSAPRAAQARTFRSLARYSIPSGSMTTRLSPGSTAPAIQASIPLARAAPITVSQSAART